MKLYKYKSISNFEHLADILCNKRFYAAQFFELNDPMEGHFDRDPTVKADYLSEILRKKMDLRFCSFSSDPGNMLLWAHYADSFRGVCIEVDVPDELAEVVRYSEFNVYVNTEEQSEAQLVSKSILTAKNKAWKYEKEYRVFSSEKFLDERIEIVSVRLGVRMSETIQSAVRRLVPLTIDVHQTKIKSPDNRVVLKRE